MNHRPSKKVINSKLAEFEPYRERYQSILEPLKEEFSQQNRKDKKWIIGGILLALACLVVLLGWIYYENRAEFDWRIKDKKKVDTVVFVATPIGMMVGLIMVSALTTVRHNELRDIFLSSLLRNINGDLRYIKKEEHDLNKTEFEYILADQKVVTSSMMSSNSFSYFISDEMKSHSFNFYNLWITSSKYTSEHIFFLVVPLRNTSSSLSNSIMNYVERFEQEYDYKVKVSIVNQKAYFLTKAPESFFSWQGIAMKDNDDESLYHLYCMIKLANEVAEMS